LLTSIRWRLAASYAVLILLSVTLMGALALYIVQRYVARQESAYLTANAREIANLAASYMDPHLRRIALEELASTSAFLGDARVRIMDSDHAVIADSGDPGLPDDFLWRVPSILAEVQAEINPGQGESLPLIIPIPSRIRERGGLQPRDLMPLLRDQPLGTSYVYARRVPTPWGRRFVFENDTTPPGPGAESAPARHLISTTVAIGAADSPRGWVEMSSPLSIGGEVLGPVRVAILISGLAALVIAGIAGFLIGGTISDPLRNLAATARRMAEGDLSSRAGSVRRDEIGDLARQFNGMAESLESSFRDLRSERDSLKRFVADASHELRTPITALATFNELLQGSAADDPEARREFLQESGNQLARLQWITANLLDLSRLDAGIAGLSLATHTAADVAAAASADARGRARDKNVSLTMEMPPAPVLVVCDGKRLEMAVGNLVANAVKFVPPGGAVVVRVEEDGRRVRFTVQDDGPGISEEDLPHVFERFYRGRGASTEGVGLGLAIAKSVAQAHEGTLSVRSVPGQGCTFTLDIPRGDPV